MFNCIPLVLLNVENSKILEIALFSNSSTKPNFTNIVTNSNCICLYIIYDSLCFGGSSTKSNIVCLAMLVPQIQCICIIHTRGGYHPSGLIVSSLHLSKQITIITTIIDLCTLHYFHLHNFYVSL